MPTGLLTSSSAHQIIFDFLSMRNEKGFLSSRQAQNDALSRKRT